MSKQFRNQIKKQHYPNHYHNIKFKTNFRNCVYEGMSKRQWKETDGDDWDVLWCEKQEVDQVFSKYRVQPNSKVNHFRGYWNLCHKDKLYKNLKRHKQSLKKHGDLEGSNKYDFLPITYPFPVQYAIFIEQYKRNDQIWIMKPIAKCQGKGIFLFTTLSRLKSKYNHEKYIVQKYISNPLCMGGRKFDMRIYALVVSYQPLTVYLYRSGFARFAHDRYDVNDLDNLYAHLTNVAINIHSPYYVKRIGGKWNLRDLKIYMMSKYGVAKTDKAFYSIQEAIIKSLQAVQTLVAQDKRSFELYGYDFLFDDNMKTWLLQVNGGPSMSANTQEDSQLKSGLIDDVMTVLDLQKILKGQEEVIGGFDLIFKDKVVSIPGLSMYSSYLGSQNNRIENLRKLARTTANRLKQQYEQKAKKQQTQQNKRKSIRSKAKPRVVIPSRPIYNIKKEEDDKGEENGKFQRYSETIHHVVGATSKQQ